MSQLTDYSAAFRQCLLDLDTVTMRKLWKFVSPHLPQPESEEGTLISLHYARTVAQSIAFRPRAYSHAWLTERGLPSGLPDPQRPRAQRMYPAVVPAVGLSVNFSSPELQPLKVVVESAMRNAILEVHAEGKITDSVLVKSRMAVARKRAFKELMLPLKGQE